MPMLIDNPFSTNYPSSEQDEELHQQALAGDRLALENLIKKHQPFVYNLAWKMVHTPALAEDLTQEILVKVVTKLGQFEGRSAFRTWLYRIAVNHILQAGKGIREERAHSFEAYSKGLDRFTMQELTDLEMVEYESEIKEMNLSCMAGMLLCLTREQRMVYILAELFHAGHRVGAEILDISPANFRQRLARARRDLYQFMNHKCGLVRKENPCRCHKRVKAVLDEQFIDSRDLLFNRKEFLRFRQAIAPNAERMVEVMEEKYAKWHGQLPFRNSFEKKDFLKDLMDDPEIRDLMNLN